MQNARAALMTQVLLNAINIVLDLWFVVGLGLGVAGVSKATLIAEIMGVTYCLWLVHRTARQLNGRWSFAKTLENEKLLRMFLLNRDIFLPLPVPDKATSF